MRVVLADSDGDVRGALRLLLTDDLGMQVVGEATDADGLWAQVQGATADLLVLEWSLLGAMAVEAVARLRAISPHLRIVALSGRPEARRQALAARVDAFISKGDLPEHVVTTLQDMRSQDSAAGPDQDSAAGPDTVVGRGHDPEQRSEDEP